MTPYAAETHIFCTSALLRFLNRNELNMHSHTSSKAQSNLGQRDGVMVTLWHDDQDVGSLLTLAP